MLTPYQFASNRPIDGVDLDGLEWRVSTNKEGKKVLYGHINLIITESALSKISSERIKAEIQYRFFQTVKLSSSGEVIGIIDFKPIKSDQTIPTVTVNYTGTAKDIAALTNGYNGQIIVDIFDRTGLKQENYVALEIVHELFHTLGLSHPTENFQTDDTKLVKDGIELISTGTTSSNLNLNLMIYSDAVIDGMRVGDTRDKNKAELLTREQLNIAIQEASYQEENPNEKTLDKMDRWDSDYFFSRDLEKKDNE